MGHAVRITLNRFVEEIPLILSVIDRSAPTVVTVHHEVGKHLKNGSRQGRNLINQAEEAAKHMSILIGVEVSWMDERRSIVRICWGFWYMCVHRAEHIGELVGTSENAPNLRTFDEGMRAKNTSPSDV
jgi:hypothetical protein